MAIRGRYSSIEKEILANFEQVADTRRGWHRPPPDAPPFMKGEPVITAPVLTEYASGLDPWNPFWNSEEYAVATRWGGLWCIAPQGTG